MDLNLYIYIFFFKFAIISLTLIAGLCLPDVLSSVYNTLFLTIVINIVVCILFLFSFLFHYRYTVNVAFHSSSFLGIDSIIFSAMISRPSSVYLPSATVHLPKSMDPIDVRRLREFKTVNVNHIRVWTVSGLGGSYPVGHRKRYFLSVHSNLHWFS